MTSPGERCHEAMVGRGQRENYASADNLAKRQALFDFADPSRSYGTPAIERISWSGREAVLDAGCGNGLWVRVLSERFEVHQVTGLDLSIGMLNDARGLVDPWTPLVAGDVQDLPFDEGTFDVVLCFWMLYHVEDHLAALEEFRRVLRPGGRLLVTTNGTALRAVSEVAREALSAVAGRSPVQWLPTLTFSAENGAEIISRVFTGEIEAEPVISAFAFPTADPVVEYIRSSRGPIEMLVGESIDWPAVEERSRQIVDEVIARDGVFRSEMTSVSFLTRTS